MGKTTKCISAAAVFQDDGPPVAMRVTHDGFGFALSAADTDPWIIDKSGKYWIELRDPDNLIGGIEDRWDVRAIADEPPRITLERPVGTLYVTAVGCRSDSSRMSATIWEYAAWHCTIFAPTGRMRANKPSSSMPARVHPGRDRRERLAAAAGGESREIEYELGPRPVGPRCRACSSL